MYIIIICFKGSVGKQITKQAEKMCQLRISRNASRPDTTNLTTNFDRNHKPLERSNTFDSLRTEPVATPNPFRKTQSAVDLTRTKLSRITLSASSMASLWRRPAQSQAFQDRSPVLVRTCECSPVEDIKQRWRCQQIKIQEKLATPEKTSIWCVLTRSRRYFSRMTRDQ